MTCGIKITTIPKLNWSFKSIKKITPVCLDFAALHFYPSRQDATLDKFLSPLLRRLKAIAIAIAIALSPSLSFSTGLEIKQAPKYTIPYEYELCTLALLYCGAEVHATAAAVCHRRENLACRCAAFWAVLSDPKKVSGHFL